MESTLYVKIKKIRLYLNIHAANNEAERKVMFENVAQWFTSNCIFVSDWSVILTWIDITDNVFKGDTSRVALFELMKTHNLVDFQEVMYPNKKEFKNRGIWYFSASLIEDETFRRKWQILTEHF